MDFNSLNLNRTLRRARPAPSKLAQPPPAGQSAIPPAELWQHSSGSATINFVEEGSAATEAQSESVRSLSGEGQHLEPPDRAKGWDSGHLADTGICKNKLYLKCERRGCPNANRTGAGRWAAGWCRGFGRPPPPTSRGRRGTAGLGKPS